MAKKGKKIIKALGEETIAFEESYLNNPNLPKVESKYVYTDAMIREIDRCKKDIIYFAEHHFYVNGMNGKEIIKLFDKQRKILRTIQGSKKTVLVSSRQWGKCVFGDTFVRVRLKFLPIPIKLPIGILFNIVKVINKCKKLVGS